MQAVLVEAPGSLRVVDLPEVRPGPGEVVIDVAYAGICGSDVEILAGRRPPGFIRYPVIPGHEWSGTVSAVGPGCDAMLVGRKVVGEGFWSCRTCPHCRAGDQPLCASDYDETGFTRPGAWAERLVLREDLIHVLADGADLRSAAGLEPAACAADAVARGGVIRGQNVAVVGGGTIGLLAVQLLRAAAPAELVVFEPNARRAELAVRFGATCVKNPETADGVRDCFDLVVEAAGAPGSATASVSLARRGGRVVLTGIPGDEAALAVRDLLTKRIELRTVFGAPRSAWLDAIKAFELGHLDPGQLVTHELPMTDAAAAVDLVAGRRPDVGKVLLRH